MQYTRSLIFTMVLCINIAVLQMGCMVTGSMIGSYYDQKHAVEQYIDRGLIHTVPVGCKIRVVDADEDTLDGRYGGIVKVHVIPAMMPCDTLKDQTSAVIYPDIGDTIMVYLNKGRLDRCVFKGIEESKIYFQRFGSDYSISVTKIDSMADSQGSTYDWSKPVDRLLIRTQNGKRYIAIHDIDRLIYRMSNKKESRTGGLAGLAIDVVIIVTVARTLSEVKGM